MPPSQHLERVKSALYRENDIGKAIQQYQITPGASLRGVAREFNLSEATLRRRLSTAATWKKPHNSQSKLSEAEEVAICKYIDRLDYVNLAVKPCHIADAASRIIFERSSITEQQRLQPLKTLWATRFIRRHNYHKGRRSALSADRAAAEELERVQEYFQKLKAQVEEGGLQPQDIWNMDETGFRLGVGSNDVIVTKRSRSYKHYISMPENREAATGIEAISAAGAVIPAFLILSGIRHMARWYCQPELQPGTAIAVTPTGYTNDSITLQWLKHFDLHTKGQTVGTYRLLIVDGHGSHHTKEAVEYCNSNNIILFGLPPHLTHLLQPLDVAVFQPLKHYQGIAIDSLVRDGVGEITKLEFLGYIEAVRKQAFKPSTIINAFKKAGIWPLNPQPIIEGIQARLPRTPSPASPTGSTPIGTPSTYREMNKLHNEITKPLRESIKKNKTTAKVDLKELLVKVDRLHKFSAINCAVNVQILRDLQRTQHADRVRKSRRTQRNRHIQSGGVLTVEEGRRMVQKQLDDDEVTLRQKLARLEKKKETQRRKVEKAAAAAEKKRLRDDAASQATQNNSIT